MNNKLVSGVTLTVVSILICVPLVLLLQNHLFAPEVTIMGLVSMIIVLTVPAILGAIITALLDEKLFGKKCKESSIDKEDYYDDLYEEDSLNNEEN